MIRVKAVVTERSVTGARSLNNEVIEIRVGNVNLFLTLIKLCVTDTFLQKWTLDLNNSSRAKS